MGRASDIRANNSRGKQTRVLKLNNERAEFDTSLMHEARVMEVMEFVIQEGGALRFGLTMDKGALAVGIYGLGDPQTKYCRTGDELQELLDAIYHSFKGDTD